MAAMAGLGIIIVGVAVVPDIAGGRIIPGVELGGSVPPPVIADALAELMAAMAELPIMVGVVVLPPGGEFGMVAPLMAAMAGLGIIIVGVAPVIPGA
jgi:hypothetical protein